MVWSEYREEATAADDDYVSGQESDSGENNEPLHPEDWQDWNSQHLLNMWMSIREYRETCGLLQLASFNDFCNFAYEFSLKSR